MFRGLLYTVLPMLRSNVGGKVGSRDDASVAGQARSDDGLDLDAITRRGRKLANEIICS